MQLPAAQWSFWSSLSGEALTQESLLAAFKRRRDSSTTYVAFESNHCIGVHLIGHLRIDSCRLQGGY
jgi:hypothetical protein